MYSNYSRENDYLQLISNWGLRPQILDESIHRDGNTLDDILCIDHSYPIFFLQIRKNIFSDHYPKILKLDEYLCPKSISCDFSKSEPHEVLKF